VNGERGAKSISTHPDWHARTVIPLHIKVQMALPRGDEGHQPKSLKNNNKSAKLQEQCYH
jgi:hypothetical protein